MKAASDVGIYSAAIRIIQVLYLVPVIVQYSTLPVLSRFAHNNNEKFRSVLEHSIGFIFLASVPLAAGGFILGTQIMSLVFGASYAPGGLALKILMLTLLFDFPTTIVCAAVFSYDRQKSLIITSAIGGILNVLFDLLLIPRFGIVGSAAGTLCAQIISNWYLWHTMKKINYFSVLPRLKKILVAGTTMAAAASLFVFLGMNLIVNVLISMAIYLLVLVALHEPLLLDIQGLFSPTADKASGGLS
jgi:O-antigen/teichoic acid export membrane protein